MSTEHHEELKLRIIGILKVQPWTWNDLSAVLSLVWKSDLIELGQDPELLSAEGLLNDTWRKKVTDPEKIHKVFKELQLINNNQKSNLLNMENTEVIPHRVPILKHFKSGKTLTHLQAINLCGCSRLSSVVNRLNKNPAITIVCKIAPDHKYGIYNLVIPKKKEEIS